MLIDTREIRHGHLFCGIGGGAKGFNKGTARVGNMVARFRCVGGIDVDASAIRDFSRLAGVPGTVLDLFSREQFIAFHGKQPPAGWHEAVPADILQAFGNERPHIVFLSAPCKGFSGLTPEARSRSDKYQALNALTERALWLLLEAYADDPVEFILFENVPRIQSRGREMLDRIAAMLSAYGYATAETTHDCGELGNLAQSRKRFLMVCRHVEKVPPFLYEPAKRPLRAVGDVLGRMPLPGDLAAGPMHRVPSLHWKTWVRLAFVEAGSDWRSLQRLAVENGHLRDYALAPGTYDRSGPYGVRRWDQTSHTVAGQNLPTNGPFSVADPRVDGHPKSVQLGVRTFDQTAPCIKADVSVGTGPYSVADPRVGGGEAGPKFNNCYLVVRMDQHAPTVSAGSGPSAGGLAVADPRTTWGPNAHESKMRVTDWNGPSRAVTASDRVGSGALSVADPRPDWENRRGNLRVVGADEPSPTVIAGGKGVQGGWLSVADPRPAKCPDLKRDQSINYQTSGFYGVVPWDRYASTVSAHLSHDNGYGNVADPRLPAPDARLVALIRAEDGTWHRPFTTLELAALQSLIDPEEQLILDGMSDSVWREHIGNLVPPDAAVAMASEFGRTLLLAWSGETFALGSTPIWVRPAIVGMMATRRVIP